MQVRIESREGAAVELDLRDLGWKGSIKWADILTLAVRQRFMWDGFATEPSPERFACLESDGPTRAVMLALGQAAICAEENAPPGIFLSVTSELPIGAGFGSSAAVVTAVLAAYLCHRGVEVPNEVLELHALEVERRLHGLPSGIDTAAVLRGGIQWAAWDETGLRMTPLRCPMPLLSRLQLVSTGPPEGSTGEVVAAVRARRDRDPSGTDALLDRMESIARAFRGLLEGSESEPLSKAAELIRHYQANLEELGVVPEPVRKLVRRIEAAGGAAKISGAGSLGGRGAGLLIVLSPSPKPSMASWEAGGVLQGLPLIDASIGSRGVESARDVSGPKSSPHGGEQQ